MKMVKQNWDYAQRLLLLLKPHFAGDAGRVARSIAACVGVREVLLTSGEYAFVVSIYARRNGLNKIRKAIGKAAGKTDIDVVMQHRRYANKTHHTPSLCTLINQKEKIVGDCYLE